MMLIGELAALLRPAAGRRRRTTVRHTSGRSQDLTVTAESLMRFVRSRPRPSGRHDAAAAAIAHGGDDAASATYHAFRSRRPPASDVLRRGAPEPAYLSCASRMRSTSTPVGAR